MADEATQTIRDGQKAWQRLASGHSWADWLCVGRALAAGRAAVMAETGSNAAAGRAYTTSMGRWLRETGFDQIDRAARSRLLDIVDNPQIGEWLESQPPAVRALNHPNAIMRAYRRATEPAKPKADRPSCPNEPGVIRVAWRKGGIGVGGLSSREELDRIEYYRPSDPAKATRAELQQEIAHLRSRMDIARQWVGLFWHGCLNMPMEFVRDPTDWDLWFLNHLHEFERTDLDDAEDEAA